MDVLWTRGVKTRTRLHDDDALRKGGTNSTDGEDGSSTQKAKINSLPTIIFFSPCHPVFTKEEKPITKTYFNISSKLTGPSRPFPSVRLPVLPTRAPAKAAITSQRDSFVSFCHDNDDDNDPNDGHQNKINDTLLLLLLHRLFSFLLIFRSQFSGRARIKRPAKSNSIINKYIAKYIRPEFNSNSNAIPSPF